MEYSYLFALIKMKAKLFRIIIMYQSRFIRERDLLKGIGS
jgi:hypothetical protein